MKLYETTFIVNSQADDASLDRQVTAVTDLIANNGGRIIREDRIGTRRLAYQIKGLSQGYYASIIFEAPITLPPILERYYKLEEPYIRYLTVLYEGDLGKLKEEPAVAPSDVAEKALDEMVGTKDESAGAAEPARAATIKEPPGVGEPASVDSTVDTSGEAKEEVVPEDTRQREPDVKTFEDQDEL